MISVADKLRSFCQNDSSSINIPVWLRILFAATGGACVFLAFPDYDMFYLGWIALALEMWAIEGLSGWKAFWLLMLAGSVTNIGGFYWLESTLELFGHFPKWLSWIGCVVVCMIQAIVFGIWGGLSKGLKSRYPRLTCASALIVAEFLWPMIFPWYVANSQNNFYPALQIADILGVLGVSLWVIAVNLIIFELTKSLWLKAHGQTVQVSKTFYGIAGAYAAFCIIYGVIRMNQMDALSEASPKLKIGMVEGDVGIWQIEPPEKLKNNLFLHHQLSKALEDQGADLIVWPESGYQSTYIWGSLLNEASPTMHEIDAIYAPWFQPHAKRIYAIVDEMFGEEFRETIPGHAALHKAIADSALSNKMAPIDIYYTAYTNGYGAPCKQEFPYVHKCPFVSVTPDDIAWYYPSNVPIGENRYVDIEKRVRPYDIASPLRGLNTAMFFGTLTVDTNNNQEDVKSLYRGRTKRKIYNTAKLVEKDGTVLGTYHKKYLMPFGEYIPFGDEFPEIYDLIPEAGSLTKGDKPHIVNFRGYDIGPIICYEDILPRYVNELSVLEPQVLLNITDDAWFGKSSEPWQHLALAALRSVEQRKWLVRSTNTGVSAFIDANGRIINHTSLDDPEILIEDVPMMPKSRTIYSYLGDVLGWSAVGWIVFMTFCSAIERRRRKQKFQDDATTSAADLKQSEDLQQDTSIESA